MNPLRGHAAEFGQLRAGDWRLVERFAGVNGSIGGALSRQRYQPRRS